MARTLAGYIVIVWQTSPAALKYVALDDDDMTRTAAAVVEIAIDELSLDSSVVILGLRQKPIGNTRSVEELALMAPCDHRRPYFNAFS